MKTKIFLIFIILCVSKQHAYSLIYEKDSLPKSKKNSFYVELLGAGILGSINYERSFKVNKNAFLLSLGGLYIPRNTIYYHPFKYLFVPLKISTEIGKRKHFYPAIGLLFEDGLEYYDPNPASLGSIIEAKKIQKSAVLYFYCSPINYRFNFKKSTFLSVNFYLIKRIYYFNQNISGLKYHYFLIPFIGIQLGKKF
jgi:hypothetical protein